MQCVDEMVRVMQVNLGVDPGLPWSVQEIGRKWDRVAVFLGDAIETTEIHTEAERTILFPDKKDGGTAQRTHRMNEP